MKKKDLCAKAGISPASVTKMGRNGFVTTEVLEKICVALDCQIGDVMEIIPEEKCDGQAYMFWLSASCYNRADRGNPRKRKTT